MYLKMPSFFTSAKNFYRRRGKGTKSAWRLISKPSPNIFTRRSGVVYLCTEILIKGKGTTVIGRGGPQGCETPRLPHFVDNRLTGGGEVVSLTRRQAALNPQEDSWYPFLLEAVLIPGP
jgi:hypothetical protein